MPTNISLYKNINDTKTQSVIALDTFLQYVENGHWQDAVLKIRTISDKKERAEAKKKLPNVTISGVFTERTEAGIAEHSGYIAIDIDDCDVEATRTLLKQDNYVYCIFTSVSGRGLCVIFKIEADKHLEAFNGIAAYLFERYQIIVDQSGKNKSRTRFASWDPELYLNRDGLKFKKYLAKEKAHKQAKAIYVETDFDEMINTLARSNICEDYNVWIQVGFALVDKFGAGGSKYFHTLSSASSKYNYDDCEKQFQSLLKYDGAKTKTSHINTIFYYAKQHNVSFYSDKTKKIISSTAILKKSGLSPAQIITNLEKFENLTADETTQIVNEAFTASFEIKGEDSQIAQVENFLKYNFEFRRNAITRKIEVNAKEMDTIEFNNIFIQAKKIFEKDVNAELLERVIKSSNSTLYNPFHEFYDANTNIDCDGAILAYTRCFETDNPSYFEYFFRKWFLGVAASTFGFHTPMLLVYAGSQNTGKTRAFRELLPKQLRSYYAESKLDKDTDDKLLMTQKLIICDDEFGGKSKYESKTLKDLSDKSVFSLREPYGHFNVDIKRIAALCGTTNDMSILNDPTGNRRIIPINIIKIDFARINAIDRSAMLLEAVKLYKSGETYELNQKEIEHLNEATEEFNAYSTEYELIVKYFRVPNTSESNLDELTATDIQVYLELKSNLKLNINRIGTELKHLGFTQKHKRDGHTTKRIYKVIKTDELQAPAQQLKDAAEKYF